MHTIIGSVFRSRRWLQDAQGTIRDAEIGFATEGECCLKCECALLAGLLCERWMVSVGRRTATLVPERCGLGTWNKVSGAEMLGMR